MPAFFRVVYEQVVSILKQLNVAQRVTLTLLSILVFISLVAIGFWGARPDYATLFSGLEQTDTGEIVNQLEEMGVPYKLGPNGSSILVPGSRIRELRVQLATAGLPKTSGFGYELFDQFKLGVTEFTQKVNYQRALETELARTISSLSQIKSARVHIVMPEESLFVDEKAGASASLVLDIMGVNSLTSTQVNGLVHLVASSVKGLSPKDITVVDTNGNVLYSFSDEDGYDSGLSMKQMDIQKKWERSMEYRISSMLTQVFGSNSSVVRVSVEMNFDKTETESEIYVPAEDQILRSERALEEGFRGTNAQPPADVNIPAGNQANSNYTKTDETRNYEVSKRIERFTKAPGEIKKVSVAVILDREVTEEQRTNLIAAISSAAGLDTENRGDVITFSNFTFDKTTLETDKKEMETNQRNQLIGNGLKNVGLVLLLVGTVFYARRTLKRLQAISGAGGAWGVNVQDKGASEIPKISLEPEDLSPEEERRLAMRNTLDEMLENDPAVFAGILRRWLNEEV